MHEQEALSNLPEPTVYCISLESAGHIVGGQMEATVSLERPGMVSGSFCHTREELCKVLGSVCVNSRSSTN